MNGNCESWQQEWQPSITFLALQWKMLSVSGHSDKYAKLLNSLKGTSKACLLWYPSLVDQ